MTKRGVATKPKPFLKWVGGKGRLISQLLPLFPIEFNAYYEPFFGGGAVFYELLPETGQINDINPSLIGAYTNIRDHVKDVIAMLEQIEIDYLKLNEDARREQYYLYRDEYNAEKPSTIRKTALLIFLNRTGFNGLYRENSKGGYNVPFGKYANPTICDKPTLLACSQALKKLKITNVSFVEAVKNAKAGDFVYLDPPYYPVNATSNFTSYSVDGFSGEDQLRLKELFDDLTKRGVKAALSNSDTPFIRDLYKDYRQEFVKAGRAINSVASKRGKISEIVVLNY